MKWKRINAIEVEGKGAFFTYKIKTVFFNTGKKAYVASDNNKRFIVIGTTFRRLKDAKKVIELIEKG